MKHTAAKILVVDDSESTLVFLEKILEERDYEVFTATSGDQALHFMEKHAVDLVITDIHMPPPDGIELMRRARDMRLSVPFIAISAESFPANRFLAARSLGAHISIQKPFSRERFVDAVEAVLDASAFDESPAKSDPGNS